MVYKYVLEDITTKGNFFRPTKYLGWIYKIADVYYFVSEVENREKYLIDIPRPGKVKTVHEARIYKFYDILNHVDNARNIEMLYNSVYYDEEEKVEEARRTWEESGGKIIPMLLEWYGDGLKQSAFRIMYDYTDDKIYYDYKDIDISEEEEIEGELTREEFNLLMQIYFGVYDDERLIMELEEKEKRGEFEGLEKIEWKDVLAFREKEDKELEKKLYEYLLLKLSRKSTKGAFEDMEKEYRHGEDRLREMEREIGRLRRRYEGLKKSFHKHKGELIQRFEKVKRSENFLEIYKLLWHLDRTYGKRIKVKERNVIRQIADKGEGIVPLPGDDINKRIEEIQRKIEELFYERKALILSAKIDLKDLIQSKKTYEQRLKNKQVPPPKIKKHYDFRRPEEEQQKAVNELKRELESTIFRIVKME